MLGCDNNNLTLDQILASILAKDSNGNCSFRIIPVADGNAPYKDCDLANIDFVTLLNMVIGTDVNDRLGIRVIQGTDSSDQCIECDNSHIPLSDQVQNHVIGLAADGFPALRLAEL